ncbi:MAG TPA: hypothetical protein VHA77_09510 [Xanthobacteraceae bacterium]|nr:hypothetical protein [Xanthobacteraceae bacterium]
MIGVSLSRWTMSYFAAALVALVAAQVLMAAGYGYPNRPLADPETLIVVHVVAIGWLSVLMCGALFQFVPVLVARPLADDRLPLPALLCLLAGLGALILGFLQLGGEIDANPVYFPLAAALLGCGFALALWTLGRTLWASRPLPLPARFVVGGLASVGATAALGIVFALTLGGLAQNSHFLDLTNAGVPIHVVAGLGGWLTFTAMGVTYRLLAMFMLAPELDRGSSRAALRLGASALALTILGGAAAVCLGASPDALQLAGAVLGLAAVALYGGDIVHLYRARKRRVLELNSRMAAFALVSLALGVVLIAVALALGNLAAHAGPITFLLAFGWLTVLGLAQMYKIVPFLTWLECYGPVIGKRPTPRVQDLVVERRAIKWFALYVVAVWGGTVALLANSPAGFRTAAAAMLVATLGLVVQMVRARRLADVKTPDRLPAGARMPHLLTSLPRHT